MIALPFQERVRAVAAKFDLSGRERGLLAGALAVGALWWASISYDGARAAEETAVAARVERTAEEQRQASLSDARFRQAVANEADKVARWAFVEPTVFIAQMQAQAELEAAAREAGLTNIEILADRPGPSVAGVQPLTLVVEGDFAWEPFLRMLAMIEQSGRSVTPVAVDVSSASMPHRLSLTLQMMYLPQGSRR